MRDRFVERVAASDPKFEATPRGEVLEMIKWVTEIGFNPLLVYAVSVVGEGQLFLEVFREDERGNMIVRNNSLIIDIVSSTCMEPPPKCFSEMSTRVSLEEVMDSITGSRLLA